MAKTITINISDVEEKILYNDLPEVSVKDGVSTEGIKAWHDDASAGKINNAWKRFQREWTTNLMEDETFTDPIPSNQSDFVDLVLAQPTYKNRKARDDG